MVFYAQGTDEFIKFQDPEYKIEGVNIFNFSDKLKYRNFIMDGGGINNSYTKSIIEKVKSFGYTIKIVFMNTPVDVCISRNNIRINQMERFVPTSEIIKKSQKLLSTIDKLKPLSDQFIVIDY